MKDTYKKQDSCPQPLKRYPKTPFSAHLWFQDRTFSRVAYLLPVFPCSASKCSHQLWCAASWDWIGAALWGHFAPYSLERQLPNHFQASVKQTSPRQQCLLSSEIAVFTMKTTDYKQERLIRGDLETTGSLSQHLRRKAIDLGLENTGIHKSEIDLSSKMSY